MLRDSWWASVGDLMYVCQVIRQLTNENVINIGFRFQVSGFRLTAMSADIAKFYPFAPSSEYEPKSI